MPTNSSIRQPVFVSLPVKTTARCADLETYLRTGVLDETRFVCASANACRSSHLGAFYEAQAHHIGRHFDLSMDGRPMRLAVVGQEYGHPPSRVSLSMRRDMIVEHFGKQRRFFKEEKFDCRNPHMRGTTSLLRLMLGTGLGGDYEGEFILVNQKPVHMFECFALVDFLLCSAVAGEPQPMTDGEPKGGTRGASTPTMQRNCSRHFQRAVEILEPTVIVSQGKGVRRWMRSVIDGAVQAHETFPIELVQIGAVECFLLTFSHPAAPSRENWGMNDKQPYLINTVAPTIEALSVILERRN